jgi:hypothetical protein
LSYSFLTGHIDKLSKATDLNVRSLEGLAATRLRDLKLDQQHIQRGFERLHRLEGFDGAQQGRSVLTQPDAKTGSLAVGRSGPSLFDCVPAYELDSRDTHMEGVPRAAAPLGRGSEGANFPLNQDEGDEGEEEAYGEDVTELAQLMVELAARVMEE